MAVRIRFLLLCLALAALAGSGSSPAPARPLSCPGPFIGEIDYRGRSYELVQLTLPREELLGTVTRMVMVWPCNDVIVSPQPSPPPPPPQPVPVSYDFPIARLTGISPALAVAAADRPNVIWVVASCNAVSPMDVARDCLKLGEGAAFRAAKGALPDVSGSGGSSPLVVGSAVSCSATAPSAPCAVKQGLIRHPPRLRVRRGEQLLFSFPVPLDGAQFSYGRRPEKTITVNRGSFSFRWRVPASGRYTLKLFVRDSNPAFTRETTYILPLNVAG